MDIKIGDKVTYKEPNSYFKEKVFSLIISNEGYIEIFTAGIKKAKNEADYIEIIKIERPNYEIVEEKKNLLNDKEKEFLKQILKYGNYKSGTKNGIIKYIKKQGYWLKLCFSEFHCNSVYIDKDLYFKELVEDEEYTLRNLGLEE